MACQSQKVFNYIFNIISLDIVNNEFLSNISNGYGAAIAVESSYDVQIIGNLFDNNSANLGGGGIYIGSNDPDNTTALIEDNYFL